MLSIVQATPPAGADSAQEAADAWIKAAEATTPVVYNLKGNTARGHAA
jgi:hypothetical protein